MDAYPLVDDTVQPKELNRKIQGNSGFAQVLPTKRDVTQGRFYIFEPLIMERFPVDSRNKGVRFVYLLRRDSALRPSLVSVPP